MGRRCCYWHWKGRQVFGPRSVDAAWQNQGGCLGRSCCVHVGSAAIFRRSRHAALPVADHSQLLEPGTQDVIQVQKAVSGRAEEADWPAVYFLSLLTSPGRRCLRTTTQCLTSEQLQRDGAANTPLLETWERNKHWNMFSGHWTAQKTDYHFYSGQLRIIWYWIILFDKCRLLNCLFYLINSPRILNLVSRMTKRSSESSDKEAGTMSCSVFSLNEIDCHKRRVTLYQLIISALPKIQKQSRKHDSSN